MGRRNPFVTQLGVSTLKTGAADVLTQTTVCHPLRSLFCTNPVVLRMRQLSASWLIGRWRARGSGTLTGSAPRSSSSSAPRIWADFNIGSRSGPSPDEKRLREFFLMCEFFESIDSRSRTVPWEREREFPALFESRWAPHSTNLDVDRC